MEQKLWLGPENNLNNFEKSLTAYTNDKPRPIVHSQSEYQVVGKNALSHRQSEILTENCKNCRENNCSQHALHRSVVTIRSNTNKSKQFKQQHLGKQGRAFQEARHKSLYLEASQNSPEQRLKTANSDYLLNSETLYRDDLRKSSR